MLRNILIFVPMLFCIIMGALAFIAPGAIEGPLGITAQNAAGRGTMTGDLGAVFFTNAIALYLVLFKGKSKLLWVSFALLGITFIGRWFDIAVTGLDDGALQPIIIEAVLLVNLLVAMKLSDLQIISIKAILFGVIVIAILFAGRLFIGPAIEANAAERNASLQPDISASFLVAGRV